MSFFSNQDINRLALHTALHQAAMGLSLAFFAAFLLHSGRSPAQVFLVIGTILVLRFFLRLGVPRTVRLLGFRNTLLLGSLLFAVEYLVLAAYDGSPRTPCAARFIGPATTPFMRPLAIPKCAAPNWARAGS
jgi:Na+/melibiose symporter-like transporter